MERSPELIAQVLARATGAPLVPGNAVRLLRDAAENYPAWLEAIRGAERYVYFENYIIRDDHVGAVFADALIAKAGDGVPVRVLYDWMGAVGKTSRRFWRRLRDAGVEVRGYNPPHGFRPLGWLHRDHRKMLSVDGRVGFVTGLCVGAEWVGDPERGIAPWRDTGVEVRGPAVAEIDAAFADAWARAGPPLPDGEPRPRDAMRREGDVALRVVATRPGTTGLLRLNQLVAAVVRHRLWITDAYFAGIPSYVQALRAAAGDGVDVRLLVPGATDLPLLSPLSRAGYRPLLEAGVRVFEWKGPMLHAKTAVADGRWARVGSSNLNIASWIGNLELDVLVEDAAFARAMERMYEQDLESATELVLPARRRRAGLSGRVNLGPRTEESVERETGTAAHEATGGAGTGGRRPRPRAGASAGRAAAGALRVGHAVGAAIGERRVLVSSEARLLGVLGVALLLLAVVVVLWPRVLMLLAAGLLLWGGSALLARARALRAESGAATSSRSSPPSRPSSPSQSTPPSHPAPPSRSSPQMEEEDHPADVGTEHDQ